jgi:DNA-binding transcriptional regulator YdaS (Cro superfamily)
MSTTKTFADLLKQRGVKPIDVSRALGVDKATVSRWCRGSIPAERVVAVERATGISRFDLRPDLAAIFVRSVSERESAA